MSETVGRVDYKVDFDGRDLPRQARVLGEKIARENAKGFADSFDRNMRSTFDRKMTDVGDRAAATLSKKGKLAGTKFATSFDNAVSSRFHRMQNRLADILSDRESFQKYARSFDTVGEAVDRVKEDLRRLRDEQGWFQDSIGRTRRAYVLTKDELGKYSAAAERMGAELQKVVDREDRLRETSERLRAKIDSLESSHRRLQQRISNVDVFRRYAAEVGGTDAAVDRLNKRISHLGEQLGHSHIDMDISRDRLARVAAAASAQGESVRRLSLRWRNLSHNTRQWTLIIGAVAAAMQDLAVLGSAAGAGILALGGALGSGVVGVGGFVAAFSVLNKELDEVPENMRGVITQFDSFKSSAKGVRDVIASSAFRQMPDSFAKLEKSTQALMPQFSRLGTVVGQTFDDLTDGLKEGSTGFNELQGFISNATEDFPALARSAGTWSVALLRGLNRANPMVDQLIGYVQKLGDRFDAFTRSRDFDDWIARSMQTMKGFGELLDATGRALNDLVTPESVVRTQKFLENLTAFMPNLSKLLNILGTLDVFGLAAQALNDFGQALEPIEPAIAKLAGAVNETLVTAIGTLADILSAALVVIGPVIEALAGIVDAIPPEVLSGIVLGITGVTLALKALAAVKVATGAATALEGLGIAAKNATTKVSGLGSKLGGMVGKAGLFGAIAAGAIIAFEAVVNFGKSLDGVGDKARKYARQGGDLSRATQEIADSFWVGGEAVKDWDSVLDAMVNGIDRAKVSQDEFIRGNSGWNNAVKKTNDQVRGFVSTLEEIDGPLAELANTNLPAAQDSFISLMDSIGATDKQTAAILEKMPQFTSALDAASLASGGLGTEQDILTLATQAGTGAIQTQDQVIGALRGSMSLTGDQTDILSGKLQKFAEQNLTTRSAARDFEASIDDLTQSIIDNGKTLDIGTEKGRNNESAIDAVANATLKLAKETEAQTGSQEKANDVISRGREELIKQLAQFGITGEAAQKYADELGLIPEDIFTRVTLTDVAKAQKTIDQITKDRVLKVKVRADGGFNVGNFKVSSYARGTITDGPQIARIGEAGPEAVVPLNRPLSQVDPSVRLLSAIAQGKTAQMASGGIGGTGDKTVIFEAGSIVVQGAEDPRRAALEVADEVAERIGS